MTTIKSLEIQINVLFVFNMVFYDNITLHYIFNIVTQFIKYNPFLTILNCFFLKMS